tara:strand:- start:9006 stop:9689 length:684 start_codon:yes stop_codon:yes gene_type:complete
METQMEEIKYSYDIGKFADILNRVIFRDYPHRAKDFVESFISNQINCKIWLVTELKNILERKGITAKRITIMGCWYGNIMAPLLLDNIEGLEQIDLIDMDEDALLIGRKFLQKRMDDGKVKINFMTKDVNFDEFDDFYTQVVINTSCEHMYPMSSVIFRNDKDVIYCLQSNDMHEIREHVNCVSSPEELAQQSAIEKIYYRGVHEHKAAIDLKRETYNRFMVIGKRA